MKAFIYSYAPMFGIDDVAFDSIASFWILVKPFDNAHVEVVICRG